MGVGGFKPNVDINFTVLEVVLKLLCVVAR